MSYSELAEYGQAFDRAVRAGHMCKGDTCPGWFYSELDSCHMCPCNVDKMIPHPEEDPEDWYPLGVSEEEAKNIIASYANAELVVIPDDDVPF